MISVLLLRKGGGFQKELLLILGVLTVLVAMPITAVMSITNVSALVGDADGTQGSVTLFTDSAIPEDRYDYGNCTYWAALRRIQVGLLIPNSWGNAATWATRALLDGYTVDHTPSQYSIMQTPNAAHGLGHVAFVESVDTDGTWHISEMNFIGFDEVDNKAMPAAAAAQYSFIHEKSL